MARPKRIWYPGAIYHVMSRGNRRLSLFKDREDYLDFLIAVEKTRELYPFRIHALCLMTNHFHMAIETTDHHLSKIMKRILHPYAVNFNRKYDFTGHLFEGRYTSCLIEDERYLLEVSRYIHLNPVKAMMVREPLAYEYSSYSLFVTETAGVEGTATDEKVDAEEKLLSAAGLISELVSTNRILGCFHHSSKEQYRMFVEGKISHAEQELLIQKDMNENEMWLPW